jgi:transcriptional regulator
MQRSLTDEEVRDAIELRERGFTFVEIARMLGGVSKVTVADAARQRGAYRYEKDQD